MLANVWLCTNICNVCGLAVTVRDPKNIRWGVQKYNYYRLKKISINTLFINFWLRNYWVYILVLCTTIQKIKNLYKIQSNNTIIMNVKFNEVSIMIYVWILYSSFEKINHKILQTLRSHLIFGLVACFWIVNHRIVKFGTEF